MAFPANYVWLHYICIQDLVYGVIEYQSNSRSPTRFSPMRLLVLLHPLASHEFVPTLINKSPAGNVLLMLACALLDAAAAF
jgi:hypothetical protein